MKCQKIGSKNHFTSRHRRRVTLIPRIQVNEAFVELGIVQLSTSHGTYFQMKIEEPMKVCKCINGCKPLTLFTNMGIVMDKEVLHCNHL